MAVKIYDANQNIPYSLKSDTEEPKTVFFLGGLAPRLQAHLSNEIIDNDKKRIRAGSTLRDTVRFGVKGWEHFQDKDGSDVPFDEKIHMLKSIGTSAGNFPGLSDKALDLIPWHIQQELFNAIQEANGLSGEDEKNSATPSV